MLGMDICKTKGPSLLLQVMSYVTWVPWQQEQQGWPERGMVWPVSIEFLESWGYMCSKRPPSEG